MRKNVMKFFRTMSICAFVVAVVFTSCKKDVAVNGVTLNKSTLTLVVGTTETLTATVNPSDAENKKVTWTSSNESVATVSGGLVTAIAAGTTNITVTTEDGGYKATCTLTVTTGEIPAIAVSLNKIVIPALAVGGMETLIATVLPDSATNKKVTWASKDNSIATVDSNGTVTGVAVGGTQITVTTVDGGHTETCFVTVQANVVNVTGIELSTSDTALVFRAALTLTAKVLPENATNKLVTWESSDESIATVDTNGVVTLSADSVAGEVIIVATTNDGDHVARCTVDVSTFGQFGFATEQTWEIGSQTWSDAVVAVGCDKETFSGGPSAAYAEDEAFRMDCRKTEHGHIFTGKAVLTLGKKLCPNGWRVPDTADFATLDRELGGTGESNFSLTEDVVTERYITRWGGQWSGYSGGSNDLTGVETGPMLYWSKTTYVASGYNLMLRLQILKTGSNPKQLMGGQQLGHAVRCVK